MNNCCWLALAAAVNERFFLFKSEEENKNICIVRCKLWPAGTVTCENNEGGIWKMIDNMGKGI